jgi:hypothetical protein
MQLLQNGTLGCQFLSNVYLLFLLGLELWFPNWVAGSNQLAFSRIFLPESEFLDQVI